MMQRLCESAGVDLIFHPEPEEMYEKDFCSFVDMTGLTEGLCGKHVQFILEEYVLL